MYSTVFWNVVDVSTVNIYKTTWHHWHENLKSHIQKNDYFPWYDKDQIENDASNNYSTVACVFVAAVKFLPSRCQATIGIYTIYRQRLMWGIYEIRRWDGLRCHELHIRFHKDWFRNSKIDTGEYTDTQTAWKSHNPILIFFFKLRK
jgi:hypothetical protein